MYDSMVIWTYNNNVVKIIIERGTKRIYVMYVNHMVFTSVG